ncbi:MAG: hypothetical protein WCC04_04540 [Terriglobales bacterium]
MCSFALFAEDVTMTTTGLMRAAGCEVRWIQREKARLEFQPPRMNWVVVTDENHNCRMQMLWTPSAADR